MTKILHIITRMDMGGSAQNTLTTCLGTCDEFEVVLVHGSSLESAMTDEESKTVADRLTDAGRLGVKVLELPSLVRRIDPLKDLRALLAIIRVLREERPDIVHTHTSKAGILGRLAAIFCRTPKIVHTTHGHVFYGHFSPGVSRLFLLVEKIFAAATDIMIALTTGEKDDFLAFHLCRKEKIITIHSGVDLTPYCQQPTDIDTVKRALGLAPDRPVIGTVGWLLPIKGSMFLLRAMELIWQSFPDAQLVYVGKGDLEAELKAEAAGVGFSDRVHFLGWRNDVHRLMFTFDLFVLPSLMEGMGRVLVEAMAAGKPLIATRVGGIPDLVRPGENGLLVPAGDAEALATAIKDLLSDPGKARRMGEAGRRICHEFSQEAMLEKLRNLYRSIL